MGYMKQGDLDSSVGFKVQNTWGMTESLVFFLEGLGASVFSLFLLLESIGGMLAGLCLMIAAVLLLFSHLGHPEKAWRTFFGLRTSWISRGTIIITLFMALGVIHLGLLFLRIGIGNADLLLKGALLFICLVILAYPGFALSSSPSVPFWNSGLLPVSFVFNGLASGASWVMVYLAMTCDTAAAGLFYASAALQFIFLGLLLISVFSYVTVMKNSGGAARESVQILLRGEASFAFLFLGVLAGVFVPGFLTALASVGAAHVVGLALVAAIARVIGDLSLRYAFIKAGIFDPLC